LVIGWPLISGFSSSLRLVARLAVVMTMTDEVYVSLGTWSQSKVSFAGHLSRSITLEVASLMIINGMSKVYFGSWLLRHDECVDKVTKALRIDMGEVINATMTNDRPEIAKSIRLGKLQHASMTRNNDRQSKNNENAWK